MIDLISEADNMLKRAYIAIVAESLKNKNNPICEKVVYRGNKPYKTTKVKIGRNDLCTCGSGKKYKKCYGAVHNVKD